MAFIVGCVVASDKDLDPTLQFAALWSSFYYIALTAAGVAILRKYKAPLPIGIFIGLVFVQSNLCLMLCAIFGNIADVIEDDDVDRPYEAFSAFQFFLFTVYSIFGVSLTVFRNELIEDPFSSEGGRNSNDEPGGGFGEKTLPPPVVSAAPKHTLECFDGCLSITRSLLLIPLPHVLTANEPQVRISAVDFILGH